ncbi:MAG TPA: hypothetical protein VLL75_17605 [Vicinamibacteria bacterium]|nr:hypothetical protein [Vicinamibacteria bacterium]
MIGLDLSHLPPRGGKLTLAGGGAGVEGLKRAPERPEPTGMDDEDGKGGERDDSERLDLGDRTH